MNNFPAVGELLMERLIFLLFAFLLVLLFLSNLVIGYGNFFRNRETSYLTSLPISAQTIFRWKSIESALLASWAFLVSHLAAAGGLRVDARGAVAFLPDDGGVHGAFHRAAGRGRVVGGAGAGAYLDRRAFQVLALVAAAVFLPLLALWFRPETLTDSSADMRVLATLDKLLMRTHFSEWPWLPSFWLSTSVLQWADGALAAAVFFMLVLLSHVFFFGCLSFTRTGKLFTSAIHGAKPGKHLCALGLVPKMAAAAAAASTIRRGRWRNLRFLFHPPSDALALLVKDARMFWRDTAQWGQTLVLLGLLGAYIINLRHFSEQLTNPFWVHLICYLNLGACALNMATLTTRFVYPQFSLEGKRLWIIGLAPMGLGQVLRAKFWLASRRRPCGHPESDCPFLPHAAHAPGPHALSGPDHRDDVLYAHRAGHGIERAFPNFRRGQSGQNRQRLRRHALFGAQFPLHCRLGRAAGDMGSPWGWRGETSVGWIFGCWAGFALFSVAVGWMPFRLALRHVENFEFNRIVMIRTKCQHSGAPRLVVGFPGAMTLKAD